MSLIRIVPGTQWAVIKLVPGAPSLFTILEKLWLSEQTPDETANHNLSFDVRIFNFVKAGRL